QQVVDTAAEAGKGLQPGELAGIDAHRLLPGFVDQPADRFDADAGTDPAAGSQARQQRGELGALAAVAGRVDVADIVRSRCQRTLERAQAGETALEDICHGLQLRRIIRTRLSLVALSVTARKA